MGYVKVTTQIDAPLKAVYRLHTTVERIAEWFPGAAGITDVTASMEQPGARYTIRYRDGGAAYEEVLQVETERYHQRRFNMQRQGLNVWGVASAHFEPIDSQSTLFTLELDYTFHPVFLNGLLTGLLSGQVKQALEREVASFSAFVEADVREGSLTAH